MITPPAADEICNLPLMAPQVHRQTNDYEKYISSQSSVTHTKNAALFNAVLNSHLLVV